MKEQPENKLDLIRLREIAEKAAPQTWVTWFDIDPRYSNEAMTHIATFNPATVLALLDYIDRLRKELDRWKGDQRPIEIHSAESSMTPEGDL